MLKTYIRYVHNRPFEAGLSPKQLEYRRLFRNRQLALFCFLGAPATLLVLKQSAIPMKEMFNQILTLGGGSQVENGGSQVENTNSKFIPSNSTLFFILSNLNKKIPNSIKIIFKMLILIIFLLKLWGFSLLPLFFLNFAYILKIVYYTVCPLIIGYHLFNLYLLHKFNTKKIDLKKCEILPEFVLNWLKGIELMSSSAPGIKELKTDSYIEITIYLIILILIILIT
jgi:hypothetical protein